MTISRAIFSGVRATWRNKWMVVIFFACNLLLAAAIAAPMHAAIADHLGNSAMAEQLARGFDWGWLTEFQISHAAFLKSFSTAIVYGSILFLILNTLLSAGAFELFRQCLAQDEDAAKTFPAHIFGRGMGKFFLRFARVIIVASLFYFAAFAFWLLGASRLLDRAFQDSPVERWHFYLNWIRVALLFATLFTINIVVDYAKADLVIDDHTSALAAIGHAAGFVWINLGRVFAIYIALGFASALTILTYAAFARYFPQSSVATIFIWFVVGQSLLWLRWMLRLASWGAVTAFYTAKRVSVPVPEPTTAHAEA